MSISLRACRGLLAASSLLCAQEAVDLDALDSKPAAPSRRAGDGVNVGGLKFNVYFDGGLAWSKEAEPGSKADLAFVQHHTSLLARATTEDGIEVYADILHPTEVFEATIPFNFFLPSLKGNAILGEASIRGGRIIVPFGEFEDHPIYGGCVNNSRQVREVVWSDYGASLRFPIGMTQTELYAINGASFHDSVVDFGPNYGETNELKGFGAKIRLDPFSWLFATGSYFHDFLPNHQTPVDTEKYVADAARNSAVLMGLDVGARFGAFSIKAGGAKGWVKADSVTSYAKSGWYAETKWTLNEQWALRVRAGQVDPDSRSNSDFDQTNVNLAGIWTKGPVDVRLTYFRNFETHWPGSKTRPFNAHRVLLETLVNI